MVQFKAKPFKVGNSYAVIIPSDYIKNKLVSIDKDLLFEVSDE